MSKDVAAIWKMGLFCDENRKGANIYFLLFQANKTRIK